MSRVDRSLVPAAGRRWAPVVAGTAGILVLAGCTPANDGRMAIGRDYEGAVVVRVVTCEHGADEALIVDWDAEVRRLDGVLDQLPGTSVTYAFDDLFGAGAWDGLEGEQEFELAGTSRHADYRVPGADFTVDQIETLGPGLVWHDYLEEPVPIKEFDAMEC